MSYAAGVNLAKLSGIPLPCHNKLNDISINESGDLFVSGEGFVWRKSEREDHLKAAIRTGSGPIGVEALGTRGAIFMTDCDRFAVKKAKRRHGEQKMVAGVPGFRGTTDGLALKPFHELGFESFKYGGAGSSEASGKSDQGTETTALFERPTAIVKVGHYLYVADGLQRIRKISTTTNMVTTLDFKAKSPPRYLLHPMANHAGLNPTTSHTRAASIFSQSDVIWVIDEDGQTHLFSIAPNEGPALRPFSLHCCAWPILSIPGLDVTLVVLITARRATIQLWNMKLSPFSEIKMPKAQTLAAFEGKWSSNCIFKLCLATNTLYGWNGTEMHLRAYKDVLPTIFLETLRTATMAPSSAPKSNPNMFLRVGTDLSKLLITRSVPHDVQLTHALSQHTWYLHYGVMACHPGLETQEEVAIFLDILSNCLLPEDSIDALINYLYFKPFSIDDATKSCTETCHAICIAEEIGLDIDFLIRSTLDSQILVLMTGKEVSLIMATLWFDERIARSAKKRVLSVLGEKVRRLGSAEFLAYLNCFSFPENLTVKEASVATAELIAYLWARESQALSFVASTSSTTSSSLSLSYFHRPMNPQPTRIPAVPVEWNSDARSAEELLSLSATDYVFAIDGQPDLGFLVGKGWLMYPQWSWFARLVDAALNESKTRTIEMPAWMTSQLLLAIVGAPHGHDEFIRGLTADEMMLALEYARFLELVDSEGAPTTCFRTLIDWCKKSVLENIHDRNVFVMLSRYHRLEMKEEVEIAIQYIVQKKSTLPIDKFGTLDSDLVLQVVSRLR